MASSVKNLVLVLGLLALLPKTALAGPKEDARRHYDRAIELIDDGQLAEAIIEFQRAHDLTKHFSVLYNIGQVCVSLAKPVEAIAAYEGYLMGGGKTIPAVRRAEVEKEIARQKSRIATLTFQVRPEGATVRVDGNVIGKSPLVQPLSVGIGEHVVSATADGHSPAEVKVTVAGEDRREIELTLAELPQQKPEPAPMPLVEPAAAGVLALAPVIPIAASRSSVTESAALTVSSDPADPPSLSRLQIAGLGTGAVGVLGMVTGGVCWLVARSRHDSAVTYWNQGGISDAKARTLQGEAQDYATAASIGLLAGGALVVTGVVLYFVGEPREPDRGARAHLTPTLSPGFAGLQAGGTW